MEDHANQTTKLHQEHTIVLQNLTEDYEKKLTDLKAMYEAMLADLSAKKDVERDVIRA
jgi:hypothetical protein